MVVDGRRTYEKPTSDLPTEQGKVVVDIEVDKDGNVVGATINVAKGNTSSQALYNQPEKSTYREIHTSHRWIQCQTKRYTHLQLQVELIRCYGESL